MAHESFEDGATAAVMNRLFVNVKVDREERPDVDAIYMQAVQAFTGRGGWPMTVMMTAEGRPFFGGTYFPREQFVTLMERVGEMWRERRVELFEQGDRLTEALERFDRIPAGSDLPTLDAVAGALESWRGEFDAQWGGFGRAPKFPPTMAIETILRRSVIDDDPELAHLALHTLDAMAAGGVYDHIGGGFARYSTDPEWLVPHFEKMLYDQALLLRAYTQGWLAGGSDDHAQVVEETIEYCVRDLRHPSGGFFSAQDADSEGVEGRFYVWTPSEVTAALGPEAAASVCDWFDVGEGGNWEGATVLRRPVGVGLGRSAELEAARRALLQARSTRVRPGLDDKVLTEWNGLMVGALADAGLAFGRDDWVALAAETADFLLRELRDADGRWLRSWQDGRARILGYAADVAAVMDGFTRLAEASGDARWIDEAVAAARQLVDVFWDDEAGGVFTPGSDADPLVTRPKDLLDNATPAANSLAAVGFMRLWALTGRRELLDRADAILRLLAPLLQQSPTAFAHALGAVEMRVEGPKEIVVVGDSAAAADLVAAAGGSFRPGAVLAWGEPFMSPLWEGRDADRAYVCQGYACQQPATTPAELTAQLTAPKFGR